MERATLLGKAGWRWASDQLLMLGTQQGAGREMASHEAHCARASHPVKHRMRSDADENSAKSTRRDFCLTAVRRTLMTPDACPYPGASVCRGCRGHRLS